MEHRMKRKIFGFTLIELMIVVVIIGILAAIGYPSYQQYVYKSRRSDAKAALLNLQLAQEKYRANCLQYATGTHTTTYSCSSTVSTTDDNSHDLVISSMNSPDGYYTLSMTATQNTYALTATYAGVQTGDSNCKTLVIDQAGTKTSTNSADAASTGCW